MSFMVSRGFSNDSQELRLRAPWLVNFNLQVTELCSNTLIVRRVTWPGVVVVTLKQSTRWVIGSDPDPSPALTHTKTDP